jgi:hypothetical protein
MHLREQLAFCICEYILACHTLENGNSLNAEANWMTVLDAPRAKL